MKNDAERAMQTWETWARTDPKYAILSSDEVHDWDDDRFMAHCWESDHALRLANEVTRIRRGRALDFGCGIGRLSQRLAQQFDTVVGVDISPTMVEEAKRLNRCGDRCQYLRADLDRFSDAEFDFVLSVYVMQHIPSSLQAPILGDLTRVLRPDGVAVLQIHGGWPGLRGVLQRYAPRAVSDLRWRLRYSTPRIEMNPLSAEQVARTIAPATVVLVRDEWYVIRA
jgi:SAM-dependent methyltransferase